MSINEFEIEFDNTPNEFKIEFRNEEEIYPELEDLEVTPNELEQNLKSEKYYGYNNVKVKAIPEKYVIPKVEGNTLILSRGNIEGGVLTL